MITHTRTEDHKKWLCTVTKLFPGFIAMTENVMHKITTKTLPHSSGCFLAETYFLVVILLNDTSTSIELKCDLCDLKNAVRLEVNKLRICTPTVYQADGPEKLFKACLAYNLVVN